MRQRVKRAGVVITLWLTAAAAWAAPYTVQPGDTLYSLARRFSTTPETLQRVNRLPDAALKVGQTLEIPERQHTVAAGETLYALARRYAVSVAALRALNQLSSDAVRVGQVLLVPWSGPGFTAAPVPNSSAPRPTASGSADSSPTASGASVSNASSSNAVQPNVPRSPTPTTAASNLGTTNPRVTPVNPNASGSTGVVRFAPPSNPSPTPAAPDPNALPALPPSLPLTEPERPAATLPTGSSAARPIATPTVPSAVALPSIVALPTVSAQPASPAAAGATSLGLDDQPILVHVVALGDTLFNIARRYGVSVADLKTVNGLSGDAISPGERLRIPGSVDAGSAPRGVRDIAERYLGVTYVYGGSSQTGLDCSGFVSIVFNELGVRLPRTSREQFAVGSSVEASALELGDLVFFDTLGAGTVSHVGIYLSDGEFIHAASNPGKVIKSKLSERYYAQRYLGARRVLPQD